MGHSGYGWDLTMFSAVLAPQPCTSKPETMAAVIHDDAGVRVVRDQHRTARGTELTYAVTYTGDARLNFAFDLAKSDNMG